LSVSSGRGDLTQTKWPSENPERFNHYVLIDWSDEFQRSIRLRDPELLSSAAPRNALSGSHTTSRGAAL